MNSDLQTQRPGAAPGSPFPFPFPEDMAEVNEAAGATCGHFAFAAALALNVIDVIKHFPGLREGKVWCSVKTIEEACRLAGIKWWDAGVGWPEHGLVIVQGLGPWMNKGVPFGARLARTHWVATHCGNVADCNATEWMPRKQWEETVLPDILREWRATGWEVKRGYAMTANNQVQPRL